MLLLPFYANVSLLVLAVLLLVLLIIRVYLRHTIYFKCEDKFEGKTVVITGANSGIGQATAVELAKRGARVILACRDRRRRDSAPFAVRSRSGNISVHFMYLDLSNLDSIVQFAIEFVERENRLDVLINNAAILCEKQWTLDGLDMVMGVNVFGHFLLTNLLLEKMKATSDETRVINVFCDAYKSGKVEMGTLDLGLKEEEYNTYMSYASSKLINLLLTVEMSRRFMSNGTSVFAVDPGSVSTQLYNNYPGFMGKLMRTISKLTFRSPENGAQTVLFCAIMKNLEKYTGKCFYNCQRKDINLQYCDDDYQQLWDKLETVLKAKNFTLNLKDYTDN